MKKIAIILAGGSGTRLWPLSDVAHPKSLLEIFNKKTMLENTVFRARLFADEIYVITNQLIAKKAASEFSNLNLESRQIIIEPEGADTAAAIAYSVAHIKRTHSQTAVIALLPVDHQIRNYGAFYRDIQYAFAMATSHKAMTLFGITPSYPSTGYGYIKLGKTLGHMDRDTTFKVDAFLEKPDAETAIDFLESTDYVWNSGIYIAPLKTFEAIIKIHSALYKWYRLLDERQTAPMPKEFRNLQFETGIIQQANNLQSVIATFDWSDIGAYDELYRSSPHTDENDNVTKGSATVNDCHNCLIIGGHKKIVALGLDDIAIIDGPDGILVCKKSTHSQIVGKIATGSDQPGAKE